MTTPLSTVRVMVALVALTDDLPMPVRMSFQGQGAGETGRSIMSLGFSTLTDGQAWSRMLGGRTDIVVNPHTGFAFLNEGIITWQGWRVQLHATQRFTVPDQPLSPNLALGLTALSPDGGGAR